MVSTKAVGRLTGDDTVAYQHFGGPGQYGTVSRSAGRAAWRPKSGRAGPVKGLAPQLLVALAVIAAALLGPFQTAICVCQLVCLGLIDAGMHAGPCGGFLWL